MNESKIKNSQPTSQQHNVSSSAGMGEGYYRLNGSKRILYWDGEKWMKPVKDQQGRYGTWLGQLDKQPKVKSAEYIPDVDRAAW